MSRLAVELERPRSDDVVEQAATAPVPTQPEVLTPQGPGAWIHTTVARVLARLAV